MNIISRLTSAPDNAESETPSLQQTVLHSFVCALVVFGVDLGAVYLSYARPFLHTASSHLQLFTQAAVFILLATVVLTVIVRAGLWIASLIDGVRFVGDLRTFGWGFALFQLLLGTVILLRSDMALWSVEAPLFALVVLVGVGAIITVTALLRKHTARPAAANLLILAALVLSLWFLRRHFAAFTDGGFGISTPEALLRTAMIFGVPLLTFGVFAFRAAAPERLLKGTSLALFSASLVAVLFGIQHIRLTLYVDNYLLIHLILSISAYLFAWSLARIITRRWTPDSVALNARRFAVVALMAVAASVLVLRQVPTTVGGYVGAVHTAQQRLVIDAAAFVQNAPSDLQRIARAVGFHARSFTSDGSEPLRNVDDASPLPSTFQHIEHAEQRPHVDADHVVVFFLDMKRPEDIGLYGYPGASTPGIDDCFDDGFVFERSYSPGNRSMVAFPAFHTGTYSATRGLIRYTDLPSWFAYQDGNNLASLFRDQGYHTNLWTDSWYWDEFFDPERVGLEMEAAFGAFDDNFVVQDRQGSVDAVGLRELFDQNADALADDVPSLNVFHIFSHPIEELPGVDKLIGQVCDQLREDGLFDDTLLLLTADHGYQLREHGRTHYGHTMFDSEIRVPHLMRVPGMDGGTVEDPVGGVDHLATITDILEFDVDFRTEGQSYLPQILGEGDDGRILFSETRNRYHSTALIQNDLKLVYWATPQVYGLFNVVDDPRERYNLVDDPDYRDEFDDLRRHLHRFLQQRGDENWRP